MCCCVDDCKYALAGVGMGRDRWTCLLLSLLCDSIVESTYAQVRVMPTRYLGRPIANIIKQRNL